MAAVKLSVEITVAVSLETEESAALVARLWKYRRTGPMAPALAVPSALGPVGESRWQ